MQTRSIYHSKKSQNRKSNQLNVKNLKIDTNTKEYRPQEPGSISPKIAIVDVQYNQQPIENLDTACKLPCNSALDTKS